jgi:hypothetical protein
MSPSELSNAIMLLAPGIIVRATLSPSELTPSSSELTVSSTELTASSSELAASSSELGIPV